MEYRIRALGNDGDSPWSESAWFHPAGTFAGQEPKQKNRIQVYPNPAYDRALVELDLPAGKEVIISMYGISGQLIWQETQLVRSLPQVISLPLEGVEAGNYLLRVQAKNVGQSVWLQVR
jgi:hypothetical protein